MLFSGGVVAGSETWFSSWACQHELHVPNEKLCDKGVGMGGVG